MMIILLAVVFLREDFLVGHPHLGDHDRGHQDRDGLHRVRDLWDHPHRVDRLGDRDHHRDRDELHRVRDHPDGVGFLGHLGPQNRVARLVPQGRRDHQERDGR